MRVYHGTAAQFPAKQLTSGPDAAGLSGVQRPGLWLTTDSRLAAIYPSWSADCTGERKHLRVIELEMDEDCPRWHNPDRPIDFVVWVPEREYEARNLRVVRADRADRAIVRIPDGPRHWRLRVKGLLDEDVLTLDADGMEHLPNNTFSRLDR